MKSGSVVLRLLVFVLFVQWLNAMPLRVDVLGNEYTIVHVVSERSLKRFERSEVIDFEFEFEGVLWKGLLEKAKVVSSDFKVYDMVGDHYVEREFELCTYRGGNDSLEVVVSLCDGGMSGVIVMGERKLAIEVIDAEEGIHGIVDMSKIEGKEKLVRSKAVESIREQVKTEQKRDVMADSLYVEVICFFDQEASTLTNNDLNDAVHAFEIAKGYYDMATFDRPIVIVLKSILIFNPNPWSGNERSQTIQRYLLDEYCSYLLANRDSLPVQFDAGVLLSGRAFTPNYDNDGNKVGNNIGLAFQDAACRPAQFCNVNTIVGSSIDTLAGTIAHEMGHNLGMPHDSDGNSCDVAKYIMAAVVDSNISPYEFSSCSYASANAFLQGSNIDCLLNQPDVCGDGYVSDNEECDCKDNDCSLDPCCTPECTFSTMNGILSECSSEDPCCDKDTCQFLPLDTACWGDDSDECFQYLCSGTDSKCSSVPVIAEVGKPCDSSRGGCNGNGRCVSYESQCALQNTEKCLNSDAVEENLCTRLVCSDGTNCLTFSDSSGNALVPEEGTVCSANSVCVEGECISTGYEYIDPMCTENCEIGVADFASTVSSNLLLIIVTVIALYS